MRSERRGVRDEKDGVNGRERFFANYRRRECLVWGRSGMVWVYGWSIRRVRDGGSSKYHRLSFMCP